MPKRILVLILVLILGTVAVIWQRNHTKSVLEYRIWHTELDKDASKLVEDVATGVETWANGQDQFLDYDVHIVVTALPWGDVAAYLFQHDDNPPDLTHLEPFMMGQVLQEFDNPRRHHVFPIDDLIAELVDHNGPISPAVADLQRYEVPGTNRAITYGLAYAVGTTYIAYRGDWMEAAGIDNLPTSWTEMIKFAEDLASAAPDGGVAPFTLPGRSPFFIAQLVGEMVVSLGGSLYEGREPSLDSPEMRKVLRILQDMIVRCDYETYLQTTYRDQFTQYAEGRTAVVPVTYGRATKQIDDTIRAKLGSDDPAAMQAARAKFQVMSQPGNGEGTPGVATIDAEPWALFAQPDGESTQEIRLELGKEFLRRFYEHDTYMEVCSSVPVHLQPVFSNMFQEYRISPNQVGWSHWLDVSRQALENAGHTAPILMDSGGGTSQYITFALSMQRSDLLADMVLDAVAPVKDVLLGNGDDVDARREDAIDKAIARAQERAMQVYEATR